MTDTRSVGGRCHLVREEGREAGLSLYKRSLDGGMPGLCITRLRPPVPGTDAPRQTAIRLSSLPGKGNLMPSQIGLLQKTILDFVDKNPGSVVFLEGLDYILVEKGCEVLVRFLYSLGDKAMDCDAIVIVSLHGTGLAPDKVAVFEHALASVPI